MPKTSKSSNSTIKVRDRIDVLTFGVGHGDCLLLEFIKNGSVAFRLLYDGGARLSPALLEHLKDSRRQEDADDLDVVVLSHVDNDHQGGLHELLADDTVSIGELWLPCLPAFERLSWLFADRVATAVAKAKDLEEAAVKREIEVIYPMEGHVQRFVDGAAVTVSVISPARRLLQRLYSGSEVEVEDMLNRIPLPLEWLIRGDSIGEGDNQGDIVSSPFNGTTAMSRELLPAVRKLSTNSDSAIRENKVAEVARSEKLEFEPNFFGNSVLNDTSLVLVVDAVLDGLYRRRVVLSGDQENWSYICSKHPMGLGPDVLKVPHHGGHVYLADINRIKKGELLSNGLGQFFIWMRPRIAIVSAKGIHNLPKIEFREAARLIGTTLICPNKRGREVIFSGSEASDQKSCFQQFNCGQEAQHDLLKLSLSAQQEDLNASACLQGSCHRGPSPVVVMQQRLIEPDESFVRWTSAEVRKQAYWLEGFLRRERVAVLDATVESILAKLDFPLITWNRIYAEAKAEGFVQFAANPEPVLRYAAAHGLIWGEDELRWGRPCDLVAALSEKEYQKLVKKLRQCQGFLLLIESLDQNTLQRGDWFELLSSADLKPLMQLCAAWSGIPVKIFDREVRPRLIRDFKLFYAGRLASLKYPDRDVINSNGRALLHLYSKSTDVQDFFEEAWLRMMRGAFYALEEQELKHILDSAKDMVLPPLSTKWLSKGFSLDLKCLHPFIRPPWFNYNSEDICVEPGEFPEKFAKVYWRQLWGGT
ncbi:MBL fold metallo-hydrolase [Aquitalea sp.]|uniref:MBL fold metallo-hydrolase n=1 Tax=Aquitalea sp. TaxID=1872623 RepID=UPI002585D72E|nr:MBL fold metallo-hydrolase [Aquitalea sp.]